MRPLLRRANGAGLNAITSNLLVVGDCATLEATLALGAVNVNHVPSRVRAPRAWLALAFPLNPLHVMRLLLDKQRYGAGMEVWLHATRCTPLHTACYLGNVGADCFSPTAPTSPQPRTPTSASRSTSRRAAATSKLSSD